MARVVEAIYEHGVLRPLEPLGLAEQQRVRVTVEEGMEPLDRRSSQASKTALADLEWLAKDARPYAGEWVALDGGRLVAHGLRLNEAAPRRSPPVSLSRFSPVCRQTSRRSVAGSGGYRLAFSHVHGNRGARDHDGIALGNVAPQRGRSDNRSLTTDPGRAIEVAERSGVR